MMSRDDLQIINVCKQTFYNLYGVFPKAQEMLEMLGKKYEKQIELFYGKELRFA